MNIENFTQRGNPVVRILGWLEKWLAAARRRIGLLPPPVTRCRKHRTGHRIRRAGKWLA